jgi:hypothetical protein
LRVQFDEFYAIFHEGCGWILVLRLASGVGPKGSHSLEQSVTYRKIKGTLEIMIIRCRQFFPLSFRGEARI